MATAYKVPKTDKTYRDVRGDLGLTFERWGVRDWDDEPNVPMSRVNSRQLMRSELGVTVRFMKGDREVVLASDSQDSPKANLKLIQLCVDDMRMIERRGLDSLMRSAYLQLEAPPAERDPYAVLGVQPGAPWVVIEGAYRALAKAAHPDAGGGDAEMAAINAAFEAVKTKEGR